MKKEYRDPQAQLLLMDAEDIIRTSDGYDETDPDTP